MNVFTGPSRQLLPALRSAIADASSITFCVSFLMESGVHQILSELEEAANRGTPIRILCGCYLKITQPGALYLLKSALGKRAEIRLYADPSRSFHPKAYLFGFPDRKEIFIGSSNLSHSALTIGLEWNYRLQSGVDSKSVHEFEHEFDILWQDESVPLTSQKLKEYAASWKQPHLFKDLEQYVGLEAAFGMPGNVILPRGPQIQILYGLEELKAQGAAKALVQAATGVGKTYLAAFDSREARKVLFIAHREEILRQAERAFRKVRPQAKTGFLYAGQKDGSADILFASIFTLARKENLEKFSPTHFDYIVIDEFHHAAASSYQKVLNHFSPRFLLGLTATPWRMDGRDILRLCDYNLAAEVDLFTAINQGALCPFRYYGIFDPTDHDKAKKKDGTYDLNQLGRMHIQNPDQIQNVIDHVKSHSGKKIIGFTCSTAHADQMAQAFCQAGIPAKALHSKSAESREHVLRQLETGEIQTLFAVDMLNEGVDIPDIDTVLFLRPTQSTAVFLQQLGRGLRKAAGKDHLTVLDFIGNYAMAGKIPFLLGRNQESFFTWTPGISVVYPQDCQVHFDLKVLYLFEQMARNTLPLKERIRQEWHKIMNAKGHVPTRMEVWESMDEILYQKMVSNSSLNIFKDYIAWTEEQTGKRANFSKEARELIQLLETTNMTKVYKLPVLHTFLQSFSIRPEVTEEQLLRTWKEFFSSGFNWQDLKESLEAYQILTDRQHLANIKANPVHFLIKSGNGIFEKGEAGPIRIARPYHLALQEPGLYQQWEDILQYRRADYFWKRYEHDRNTE